MLIKSLFFLLFSFASSSIVIKGKIDLENPTNERIISTTVSLLWGGQTTSITEEGEFTFVIEKHGFYLIRVNDDQYHYPPILIDAKTDEVKAYEYNFRHGKGKKKRMPIRIKSDYQYKIGEEKQDIIKSIIRSPYVIMISVGLLLFLCIRMVPQEELREQQEEMRKKFKEGGFGGLF